MTAPGERAVVRLEDRCTALSLVGTWLADLSDESSVDSGEQMLLQGMLAAALADAYWRGHADGFTTGRRSQADAIRQLLELGEDQ